ncbi:hypothetical protein QBC40DRAFT_297651 [Triangularia verruculosa]|uniref:Uncharacterized protein n=1 Tax=Triangularia verruculosa TaxID=2587418 RepID=A0AAN6XFK6_9PEZI|nr:hypothetical protein QBC40DRAFT_297651 [Triangularia verruculosa]
MELEGQAVDIWRCWGKHLLSAHAVWGIPKIAAISEHESALPKDRVVADDYLRQRRTGSKHINSQDSRSVHGYDQPRHGVRGALTSLTFSSSNRMSKVILEVNEQMTAILEDRVVKMQPRRQTQRTTAAGHTTETASGMAPGKFANKTRRETSRQHQPDPATTLPNNKTHLSLDALNSPEAPIYISGPRFITADVGGEIGSCCSQHARHHAEEPPAPPPQLPLALLHYAVYALKSRRHTVSRFWECPQK